MADFASLGDTNNIPYTQGTAEDNALGLSNPDSVLSGTNRGTQNLGSRNIRSEPENTRIVVDDNTTNRVSFGKIGTGVNDWGLKVSKPTFNVDTATANQLIFNSSQNVFKIFQKGLITLSGASASSSNTQTVTLVDYGAAPIVTAFMPAPNYSTQLPSFNMSIQAGYAGISNIVYHNAAQIGNNGVIIFSTTNFNVTADPNTYHITYFILQETYTI